MNVLICTPTMSGNFPEFQTLSLVRSLVSSGHRVATACYNGHTELMADRFRQCGSELCLIDNSKGDKESGTSLFARLLKGLRSFIKHFKPDVAHVLCVDSAATPIIVLKILGVKKVIATAYNATRRAVHDKLTHLLEKHFVNAVHCPTQTDEANLFGSSTLYSLTTPLRGYGNHFTIYNCLPDLEKSEHPSDNYSAMYHTRQRSEDNTVTIGVVMPADSGRGSELIIPAFRLIHNTCPETRLIILGQGKDSTVVANQIEVAGLQDYVSTSYLFNSEGKAEILGKIDIMMTLSSDTELAGMEALLAMAYGCIPVSPDAGAMSEIIIDGKSGMLYRPGSYCDLAERIIQLSQNKELREKLQTGAMKRSGRFSCRNYHTLISDLYARI